MALVAEAAHILGLVPLAWLLWLRWRGAPREAAWWWIAAAFAVSFVADFFPHALAQQVYPVMQAALIALVLLERPVFVAYVALLLFAASLSIVWRGAGGYDVILRAVAWGGVSGLAMVTLEPSRLRATLAAGFALMFLALVGFTVSPDWTHWTLLQLARVGTTVGFCAAASRA